MKKILAIGILLIFILVFSVTAFAEEPTVEKTYSYYAELYSDGTFKVNHDNFSTLITIPWENEKSLITKVIFSSSTNVTAIPKNAFSGCVNLTEIIIPSSVTSIDTGAFNNCNALTSITIPDSVTSIGNSAFNHCDALVSIAIPDSVVSIGERAFSDCKSLSSVTFGENSSLNSIGIWAFNQCDSLTNIIIPDSVTSIGNSAFNHCDALVSIAIPDSVVSIGDNVFNQCYAITEINYKGSAEKWNSIAKGMAAIPNGVKINHIGSHIDEDTDHICDLCGEKVGIHSDGDKDHFCDYGCSVTFETHEEAYKSHSCDYCGAVVSNCKDDDGNHICDVCDMELAHDYPTDWKADGINHWHECSCGKKKDEATHSGGKATCSEKAICKICGFEYGSYDPNNHDYDKWETVIEATETRKGKKIKTCSNCGAEIIRYIKPLGEDGIEEILPGEKGENEFNPSTGAPVFEPFTLIPVLAVGAAIIKKRR